MSLVIPVLTADQSVLAIVRYGGGDIESVTVFVPYSETQPEWVKSNEWYASKWDSHWGPVDICYSWKSTYMMLERPDSGFRTGVPLPTESFAVLDRVDALKQAKDVFNANR